MGKIRRPIKNVRKDKTIFSKTAVRTHVKNLPGHAMKRGGTCL